jgi:predicted aminopeptidase
MDLTPQPRSGLTGPAAPGIRARRLPWRALPMSALLLLAAIGLGGFATGCSTTMGYYWQALDGQMALVRQARPIGEVISDPLTGDALKLKLERVREIRAFASGELGLPDNGSYRRYADLKRRFVVWNVFAAPEFSIEPKEWCFPVAGCVGYRGYFDEAGAQAFAKDLAKQGMDVYVGGVPAYSTLGWLDDPVLNTFIHYPEAELARLIFHELSHQVAYAPGDSMFNESFAVSVENEGVERWIARHGTPEQRIAFEAAQRRKTDFAQLVTTYRDRFAAAYAASSDAAERRAVKERLQAEMRADYARLKESWGGFAGYDWWFEQPLNNAQLASVALYTELVPGFERLLAECDGDLPQFYARVKELAKLPEAERRARLGVEGVAAAE